MSVLHRVEGGVWWIVLDRPEVRNALAPEGRERVIELLEQASADPEVRAVVIAATGSAFCSGADLRASQQGEPRRKRAAGDVARAIRMGAQRLVAAVLDCEKPVVAAVQGVAAGIGAHLAFACDLVVASDDARFVEVFVRRGLVPDGGGAYLLPRLVGVQKAKELMFLGDDVPAEEALRLGLVYKVVPPDKLEDAVRELAGRLASGATPAIAATKWLVNRSLESPRATCFADEATAQELNMSTHDAQEGVRSFVERRDPEFRGS